MTQGASSIPQPNLMLDDVRTTEDRVQIIEKRGFLNAIYNEWFDCHMRAIPEHADRLAEIGTGGKSFKSRNPQTLTSDILAVSHVDVVMDAQHLPFADESMDALILTNVLHHIPDVQLFLKESVRCLRSGGVATMIEPWVNGFSSQIYRYIHHEPFDPTTRAWSFKSTGALSGANQALPWIVFERDRQFFDKAYPTLGITDIHVMMPLSYILSGGFSAPPLLPGAAYRLWRGIERRIPLLERRAGLFAHIVLTKT